MLNVGRSCGDSGLTEPGVLLEALGRADPEFLEVLLTTLGDRPEEICYIDNCRDVLDVAEQRGLNVVHYTTGRMKQIEPEFRQLGVPV